jgi:4-hydroxybenzoyl-CoA thioesterase
MGLVHVFRRPIAFGDTDQAGILYYPNLFHYCHQAMESLVPEALGISYAELLNGRRLGFPTVHIDADYRTPMPYGVELTLEVTLTALGRKSLAMRFRGRCAAGEAHRAWATITKVCVDMRDFKGVEIPDWIRDGLAPYLEAPAR